MRGSSINKARAALFLGLLLAWTPAGRAAKSPHPPKAPVIRFESDLLNLGTAMEGAVLTARFRFRNPGGSSLIIQQVKTGCCGITVMDYPREVPAGGIGEIHLRINTMGGGGERTFKAAVHANAPASPVVLLKAVAQVTPLLSITPDRVFLTGLAGKRLEQKLEILWRGEKPLAVKADLNDVAAYIRVKMQPLIPGKRWLMRVENRLPSPGRYRGRLMLATDFPGKERKVVPVFGRITAEVEAYPPRLVLTPVRCPGCRKQRKYSGEVTIRCHDDIPFHVQTVKAAAKRLKWQVEPLIKERAYRIRLRYRAQSGQPLKTQLQIHTDRKGYELLRIPVTSR